MFYRRKVSILQNSGNDEKSKAGLAVWPPTTNCIGQPSPTLTALPKSAIGSAGSTRSVGETHSGAFLGKRAAKAGLPLSNQRSTGGAGAKIYYQLIHNRIATRGGCHLW